MVRNVLLWALNGVLKEEAIELYLYNTIPLCNDLVVRCASGGVPPAHAELVFDLLLVGVGDPVGNARVCAAKAIGGGGAGVVVVYLPAALAGVDRLHDDRAAVFAAAAGGVAGEDLAVDPGGAGAAGDAGSRGGAAVTGGVFARGAVGAEPGRLSDFPGECHRTDG